MLWKILPVPPIISFAVSTVGLIRGDYDKSGLPDVVIPLHIWVNFAEALGWAVVLYLVWRGSNLAASKISVFLAGMWCWDMVTTMHLPMPVPPLQIIWGPLSVFAMLLFAYEANLAHSGNSKVS